MDNIAAYLAASFVIVAAGIIAILSILSLSEEAPASVLSVHDRAVWGIGEDGTRVTPQPETIHIILK